MRASSTSFKPLPGPNKTKVSVGSLKMPVRTYSSPQEAFFSAPFSLVMRSFLYFMFSLARAGLGQRRNSEGLEGLEHEHKH